MAVLLISCATMQAASAGEDCRGKGGSSCSKGAGEAGKESGQGARKTGEGCTEVRFFFALT